MPPKRTKAAATPTRPTAGKPAAAPTAPVRWTAAPATLVQRGPGATLPPRPAPPPAPAGRSTMFSWVSRHKVLSALVIFLVLGASVGLALVTISQPFTATPTAGSSPVCFAAGDDITSLVNLGLAATPTITTGCGSASITFYGIPGATALSLGEILEIRNADTADDAAFTVTLSVAGSPAGTLTGLTMSFVDDVSGTPTTRNWNLLTTPSLTAYTLSDGETWELSVSNLLMTALATGSQGALTITATITEV